jgi:hypothetical protein
MSTLELEQIKQRVLQVRELIRTQEALLIAQPGNFAQRLALDSLRAHHDDLDQQANLLDAEMAHGLNDLRLVGN